MKIRLSLLFETFRNKIISLKRYHRIKNISRIRSVCTSLVGNSGWPRRRSPCAEVENQMPMKDSTIVFQVSVRAQELETMIGPELRMPFMRHLIQTRMRMANFIIHSRAQKGHKSGFPINLQSLPDHRKIKVIRTLFRASKKNNLKILHGTVHCQSLMHGKARGFKIIPFPAPMDPVAAVKLGFLPLSEEY
jgi:hypothetical protein